MKIDDYYNKGGHNDTPPVYPRPEPPKGQKPADSTLSISIENIISNMDVPNSTKEQLYLDIMQQKGLPKGTVLWKNDRIVGFRPNEPIEQISIIIKIDKDGVEIENGKETN